ncbi:alkaline phosphatase family protein, partial [Pseudomonas chlororaphis]|nr:alkaline phosphatase family protein [Pseudomonas chlororaphis]
MQSAPPATLTSPPVLAGPLLRRLEPTRLVLWLVGSRALELTLRLQAGSDAEIRDYPLTAEQCQVIPIGRHAFIHLIDLPLDNPLPC